jgi:hypothetical protein
MATGPKVKGRLVSAPAAYRQYFDEEVISRKILHINQPINHKSIIRIWTLGHGLRFSPILIFIIVVSLSPSPRYGRQLSRLFVSAFSAKQKVRNGSKNSERKANLVNR